MTLHTIDAQVPRMSRRLLAAVGVGFLAILLTLVAVGLALNQSHRAIQRNVELIADVEEPESAATYEMEINVLGAGLAVKKYLLEGDASELERLSKDEADFVRFHAEYERLGDRDYEHELAQAITALNRQYRDIGRELLRLGDRRVALHSQIAADVEEIDHLFVATGFAEPEGKAKDREALGLQADIGELGTWVGAYLTGSHEPHRKRVLDDVANVRDHLTRLQEFPLEPAERKLIGRVKEVAERIAEGVHDILEVGDTLRGRLAEYGRVRNEMDDLLDDRIQARTRADLETAHDNVRANLQRLLWMSLLLIGIAAFVVLGAAIAIYWQSVRLRDVSVDELRAAFSRLSDSEMLRGALLRRVVSAQEEERGRIARDLHDQMSQNLSALSLGLASLQRATDLDSDRLHDVESLQQIAYRLADDVHFVAWNLRPAVLDDLGLHDAVASLVESWASRAGVAADFYSEMENRRLPEEIETTLYRVTQEALTNTARHARAKSVSIVLKCLPDHVRLVVEDDGCGFDVEALLAQRGPEGRLGLMGMKERIEDAGGSLEIDSSPGQGTTIVASVPVQVIHQEGSVG